MSNSSRNNRSKRRNQKSQESNSSPSYNTQPQLTRLQPKTKNQDRLIKSIRQNHITIASGNAGVGKSLIAIHEAVWMLEKGLIDKILYTKPTVNFLEQKGIGFLPGPQPLHSKVLTPDGWVTHKDLIVGSFVTTPTGDIVKVLGIYNKGIKKVYKVTTTDGSVTECCLDHLWSVATKTNPNKFFVTDTQFLKDNLETTDFRLPKIDVINFNSSTVSLPPYLLGALLSNGDMSNDRVKFYNTDQEVVKKVADQVKSLGCILKQAKSNKIVYSIVNETGTTQDPVYTYTATKNGVVLKFNNYEEICDHFSISRYNLQNKIFENCLTDGFKIKCEESVNNCSNSVRAALKSLNLDGCIAQDKFVPADYKYNSVEIRLEILKGLLDTNGTCNKSGEVTFFSTSKQLVNDVIEIVKSLGGRAKLRTRDDGGIAKILGVTTNASVSYECALSLPEKYNPFFISRKQDVYSQENIKHNYIKSIELVGSFECQCILIDHPDHLYITDDYIVTHNTVDEKLLPLMFPLLDNLEVFVSSGKIKYMLDKKQIEFQLLEYVRGRSLRNTFVICDEFQSVSPLGALTMISRIEESSKLVVLGDPKQADIKLKSNALEDSLYRLQGADSVGIVKFQREDIVRSSFLQDVITRYDTI